MQRRAFFERAEINPPFGEWQNHLQAIAVKTQKTDGQIEKLTRFLLAHRVPANQIVLLVAGTLSDDFGSMKIDPRSHAADYTRQLIAYLNTRGGACFTLGWKTVWISEIFTWTRTQQQGAKIMWQLLERIDLLARDVELCRSMACISPCPLVVAQTIPTNDFVRFIIEQASQDSAVFSSFPSVLQAIAVELCFLDGPLGEFHRFALSQGFGHSFLRLVRFNAFDDWPSDIKAIAFEKTLPELEKFVLFLIETGFAVPEIISMVVTRLSRETQEVLLRLIFYECADLGYPYNRWPLRYKQMMLAKEKRRASRAALAFFFLFNGFSPDIITIFVLGTPYYHKCHAATPHNQRLLSYNLGSFTLSVGVSEKEFLTVNSRAWDLDRLVKDPITAAKYTSFDMQGRYSVLKNKVDSL